MVAESNNYFFNPTDEEIPKTKNEVSRARVAWIICCCFGFTTSISKSISIACESGKWIGSILALFVGYIFADFGSGVYHWAIDNYGSEKTLILGTQIANFQGHHRQPWLITEHSFDRNLHIQAKVLTMIIVPLNIFCNNPSILGFLGVVAGFALWSQQFHVWVHTPKSKLPRLVVRLQDAGIIVVRQHHAMHHKAPFDNNYCIVSGWCNGFLDRFKIFVAMEVVLFHTLGVRPRSWGDVKDD